MTSSQTPNQEHSFAILSQLLEAELGIEPARTLPIRAPDTPLCLSYGQQLIWYLEQLQPGMDAYNLPHVLRLHGTLDMALLQRCIDRIIERHTSLHMTFPAVDGAPTVCIRPHMVPVTFHDMTGCTDAALADEIHQAMLQPFDLAHGPLLRITLLRRSANEHVLLSVFHHIIFDGWSLGIFTHELTELYTALAKGDQSPLAALPIDYSDFAAWQRQALATGTFDPQIDYWKRQLNCDRSALALPTDFSRPPVQSLRGATVTCQVGVELTQVLRTFCQRENLTLYMVLLASFQLILHRYTGRTDILVGSPIAGRTWRETEPLIGFFVNMVALRTSFTNHLTVHELLAQVRDTALGAYANQDVPFGALIDVLQPERDLSHTPIFQVSFNVLNMPDAQLNLPKLTVQDITPAEGGAKFDMTLYVQEYEDGLALDLNYNPDLFQPARMDELLRQFVVVASQIVNDPHQLIVDLDLVTPHARTILPDPHAPLDSTWHGSIPTLFERQAVQAPHQLAVVDASSQWTYAELDQRSNQLAHHLHALGVEQGSVVALLGHRGAPLVQALLGILKAGCAFVICDPAYPAARLAEIIDQVQPQAFIHIDRGGALPPVLATATASLPHVVLFDQHTPLLDAYVCTPPTITITADSPACIGFTSGSTGNPKGIIGRHGPLTHFVPWLQHGFDLRSHDRYSLLSGLAYDPLQREIFTPLCLGATICIPDSAQIARPDALVAWMREQAISVAHLTPALGQMLTEAAVTQQDQYLPMLRYAFYVGDVLTRGDVERVLGLAPNVTVVNYYGSTETQRAVSYTIAAAGHDRKGWRFAQEVAHLGKGIADVQLLVINPAGKQAGIGELGEIWVRSPHLAQGYLNDSALTAARFGINPFTGTATDRVYRTGDLGRYTPDGNVIFAGRADSQVKIRGFRIELGEIEAALMRHYQIHEAVVLVSGAPPRLVAYVVANTVSPPATNELRIYLKAFLPDYMVPHTFVPIERIPVTPNGKVDRVALAAMGVTTVHNQDYSPPYTQIEQMIADAWREVLGVERVGLDDNFFDLGGSSVHMVQVHTRLRSIAQDLSVIDIFFKYPTIRALVEQLTPHQMPPHDVSQSFTRSDKARMHQRLQLINTQRIRRERHRRRM